MDRRTFIKLATAAAIFKIPPIDQPKSLGKIQGRCGEMLVIDDPGVEVFSDRTISAMKRGDLVCWNGSGYVRYEGHGHAIVGVATSAPTTENRNLIEVSIPVIVT